MKMILCAGVFALATLGLLSVSAPARATGIAARTEIKRRSTAAINIARIKSVLKLTPAQEPYWAPVETALRDLARQQAPVRSTASCTGSAIESCRSCLTARPYDGSRLPRGH